MTQDQNNKNKSSAPLSKREARKKIVKNSLEEEAILTPTRTIIRNYLANKIGVAGLIVFVVIFAFSFIGSRFRTMDLTYTELANANIPPGMALLSYPKELAEKKVAGVTSGISYSYAWDEDGKSYVWGSEVNQELAGVSNYVLDIPEEVQAAKIVHATAGVKHILAVDDQGNFYGWGHYANQKAELPEEMALDFTEEGVKVKQMVAGPHWSAVLGDNGHLYFTGSSSARTVFRISSKVQGHIEKVVAGDINMALLLDDGSVRAIGDKGTEFRKNLPKELRKGEVKIVDIAATNRNVLALDETGKTWYWGSSMDGLGELPAFEGKPVFMEGGYKHFVVLTDQDEFITWGSSDLNQAIVPEKHAEIKKVYTDYHQSYGLNEQDQIVEAWGNQGYIFGSDQYGRDMLTRIIHGGRISLIVGAIAMIISTIIAMIIGLISGYFGGWVDMGLMRLADLVTSIPLLPLAITLSYAVGNKLNESQRLYMIMIIIGLLSWTGLARLIRAQLLLEREKDFVLAAQALGIKQRHIMSRHILPNIFNLVIVSITTGYAGSLLTEAGLSFLGFGVAEPTPSWGNMLTSAQDSTVVQYYWWRWFIPAMFVVVAALTANLIGDALREAMDPRSNEK